MHKDVAHFYLLSQMKALQQFFPPVLFFKCLKAKFIYFLSFKLSYPPRSSLAAKGPLFKMHKIQMVHRNKRPKLQINKITELYCFKDLHLCMGKRKTSFTSFSFRSEK